jgi:hypothetical protein
MRRVGLATIALPSLLGGCGSDPAPYTIAVRGGLDGPPLDGVASVELRIRKDTERAIARVPTSAGGIELPDPEKVGVGAVAIAGLDEAGRTTVYGRTPPFDLAALAGRPTLPLAIFVQRAGSITRALRLPSPALPGGCGVIGARYLMLGDASGDATTVDLLTLRAERLTKAFARPPTVVATAGSRTLALSADGRATLVDHAAATSTSIDDAPGISFTELVSAQVLDGDDGAVWIVGPTGATFTDLVVRFDRDGRIRGVRLSRPRKRALAAYVSGRGLVVGWGEARDGAPLGAEIVAPGDGAAIALPWPARAVTSGVLVARDARLLRLDPSGARVRLDLACTGACEETALPTVDPAKPARDDDRAVALEDGTTLIARGGTIARLPKDDDAALEELEPLSGALTCMQQLPTGVVAVATTGDDVLRTVAPNR